MAFSIQVEAARPRATRKLFAIISEFHYCVIISLITIELDAGFHALYLIVRVEI